MRPEFDIKIGDKITVILLVPYKFLCKRKDDAAGNGVGRQVMGYFARAAQPVEITVEGFVGDMVIATDGNLYELRPDEKDGPFFVLQRTSQL